MDEGSTSNIRSPVGSVNCSGCGGEWKFPTEAMPTEASARAFARKHRRSGCGEVIIHVHRLT